MSIIKEFRDTLNLTQAQLADKLGISTVTLSRYENNNREPRLTELKKMAKIFDCKIDDLVNPTPPPAGSQAQQGKTTKKKKR